MDKLSFFLFLVKISYKFERGGIVDTNKLLRFHIKKYYFHTLNFLFYQNDIFTASFFF